MSEGKLEEKIVNQTNNIMLEAVLKSNPELDKGKVEDLVEQIRTIVLKNGDEGMIALALVSSDLAAAPSF
jgi:hypothetical protein